MVVINYKTLCDHCRIVSYWPSSEPFSLLALSIWLATFASNLLKLLLAFLYRTHAAMNLDLSSHDILSTINEQSDTNEEHTETIADAQSISDATQLSAFLFSARLGEYEEICRNHAIGSVDELNMLNAEELEELIPKLEHRNLFWHARCEKAEHRIQDLEGVIAVQRRHLADLEDAVRAQQERDLEDPPPWRRKVRSRTLSSDKDSVGPEEAAVGPEEVH